MLSLKSSSKSREAKENMRHRYDSRGPYVRVHVNYDAKRVFSGKFSSPICHLVREHDN